MKTLNDLRIVLMLCAVAGVSVVVAAQNLRELAREQSTRNPGVAIDQPAPPGDYGPKTIAQLAREADVVLLGRLKRIGSYLSSNEDRVLTDYSIAEANTVAGHMPVVATQIPGKSETPILTVFGGEVTVE